MSQGIEIEVYALTDVGRTREHNEDAFVVSDFDFEERSSFDGVRRAPASPVANLFMVADGMGGAAAGELASAMAIDTIVTKLRDALIPGEELDGRSFARSLRMATEAANARIHQFANENAEHRGMGTTATIAGLRGDTLYLSQVGDSRAYLVRNGVVRQLTKDQSLMQRLVEAGEITPEEAEQSERRNIILQALGPEPTIRSDITHQQVRRGDVLILCSDGLSGQVKEGDIERALAHDESLEVLCHELVALANARGGPDNITIVAARFTGRGLADPGPEDSVAYTAFQTVSGEVEVIDDPITTELRELARGGLAFPQSPPVQESRSTSVRPAEHVPASDIGRIAIIGILLATFVGVAFIVYQHLRKP